MNEEGSRISGQAWLVLRGVIVEVDEVYRGPTNENWLQENFRRVPAAVNTRARGTTVWSIYVRLWG